MDYSDQQSMNNRQVDHLGVNKMGKNIKKSPLHQPNVPNSAASRQQPQPQVYNINKNDFRSIVQQLTGSPSRDPQPRPPQNNPKPPNHRLQRIRPPPLAPTARPQVPMHPHQVQMPAQGRPMVPVPYGNNYARPPPPTHYDQASPTFMLPATPNDVWSNTNESPISAYMRYLQNSIIDQGPQQNQPHPHPHMQPQMPVYNVAQPHYMPNHVMSPHVSPRPNGPPPPLPSPQMNGPPTHLASPRMNGPPPHLASPRMNGPPPSLPSPRMNGPPHSLPSPRMNGPPHSLSSPRMNGPPPLLPSPTSQFLLPSPTGFFNMMSPRSAYPLLSPGYPPMSPNFSFSGQSGILGPGPHPPPSPGYGYPISPSGFFHISSPRWRDQ